MIKVVAALIMRDNKVLIARRSTGDENVMGKWEFPGGKVEQGEDEARAIEREIEEEFELKIKANKFLINNVCSYPTKTVDLRLYDCEYISGDFKLHDHSEYKWVSKDELLSYDDADKELKHQVVDDCVANLPARCKEILTLFYFKKKSLDEILQIRQENTSKDGLKSAKSKCMRQLEERIIETFKEYNEATYSDETWGVYKKHGLKAKAEGAQSYENTSSLVQEFHDKMFEVYHEIEKDGKTGVKFDAPYQVEGSFVTSFGYHKVAITEAGERVYATKEPDKTLGYEELRDAQLALITENVGKLYLEMQKEDYEDNKEEILKELGFDADYKLDKQLEAAIKAYYVPAIEALENETEMDLQLSHIRETAVKEGKYVFTNTADKEYYLEFKYNGVTYESTDYSNEKNLYYKKYQKKCNIF